MKHDTAIPTPRPDGSGRLRPGDKVGDGTVRELLGLGSRTLVYRVERGGSDVVLKVFEDPDASLGAQLKRVVERLASISHPNVVGGYELLDESGLLGLWMDFVPYPTLAESLFGGPLPVSTVEDLGRQIIDAVAAVHESGLVHPDLVPWNVRVGDDRVWLGGLGAPESQERSGLSADDELDALSNVFSLGVVLYELACGMPPFFGEPEEIAAAIAGGRFRRPRDCRPDLPAALDRAIAVALEPDREHRVPDVLTLGRLWNGETATWEQPSGLPMLRETPITGTRAQSPPVLALVADPPTEEEEIAAPVAAAGAEAAPEPAAERVVPVILPTPVETVAPVSTTVPASAPAPAPAAPAPSPAPTDAVFVQEQSGQKSLVVGIAALALLAFGLVGGLGVAAGMYFSGGTEAAQAPVSVGTVLTPREPVAPRAAPKRAAADEPAEVAAVPVDIAEAEPTAGRGDTDPVERPSSDADEVEVAAAPAVEPEVRERSADSDDAVAVASDDSRAGSREASTPAAAPAKAVEPTPAEPEGDAEGTEAAEEPPAPVEAVAVPTAVPTAAPVATPASGPRVVHRSLVQQKSVVRPSYPMGERDAGDVTCLATVTISDKGLPTNVTVASCPESFADSTTKAMMKARFNPPVIDGETMEVVTTLPIKFSR